MDSKELIRKINAFGKKNETVKAEIQTLGLACLQHGASAEAGGHGDVMPLNRLIGKLQRSQVKAFVEWALAYGMVKRNTDKATQDAQPLCYDKSRTLDLQGATDKVWDDFAPEKAESVAKAFDLQAAVMRVLKQAAEAGKPQSVIEALAKAAGCDLSKVPRSKEEVLKDAQPAAM